MKRIKSKVWYLGFFLFFFFLMFFMSKYIGDGYRGKIGQPTPLSWQDSIANIPQYAFLSAIFTAWIYYIHRYQLKKDRENKS